MLSVYLACKLKTPGKAESLFMAEELSQSLALSLWITQQTASKNRIVLCLIYTWRSIQYQIWYENRYIQLWSFCKLYLYAHIYFITCHTVVINLFLTHLVVLFSRIPSPIWYIPCTPGLKKAPKILTRRGYPKYMGHFGAMYYPCLETDTHDSWRVNTFYASSSQPSHNRRSRPMIN